MILIAVLQLTVAQQKQLEVRELVPGQTIDQEVERGETRKYRISLRAGEFVRVVVTPQAIDLAVTLYGPDGEKLLESDFLKYPGPEPLSFVAEKAGDYVVATTASARGVTKSSYVLTTEKRTAATEADKERLAVEALLRAAVLADQPGSKESMAKALELYGEGALRCRSMGEKFWEAFALHYRARTFWRLGENQKALELYNEALDLRIKIDDVRGKAATLNNIALVYKDLKEKEKVLEFYNNTLATYKGIGDRRGEAQALASIGGFYNDLDEKQNALDFYGQALTIYKADGDERGEANTLRNIGRVYSALGERQKALEFYNKTLAIYRAVGDRASEAEMLLNIGFLYSGLSENQKALDFYNQALPVYKSVGDKKGEAIALGSIGNVYRALGDKQKTLDFYTLALAGFKAAGDKGGEASALLNIGIIYDQRGERQKALGFYEEALPLSRAAGDKRGEARVFHNMAVVYGLSDRQKAADLYNQALNIERAIGDKRGEATTLWQLGTISSIMGENQKALKFFSEALPLYHALGAKGDETDTLNGIAVVYNTLGEKQKALDFYNQAVVISRIMGDKARESAILSNIGGLYKELGESQKALEFYNRALPVERASGNRDGEASTLIGIGNLYNTLGEYQKALDFFNQALPIARAIDNKVFESGTLLGIGNCYRSLDEQQKALEFYNQALPVSRAIGDRAGEANALSNIGGIYYSRGETQKALELYNQVLSINRDIDRRKGEAGALNDIALVFNAIGEKQKALEFYNNALPLERAIGDKVGEANTLINLMVLWRDDKKPGLAIFYGKRALNTYQQLRSNLQGMEEALQKTYLKTIEGRYRSLADLLITQGRLSEAEQVLALLKTEELFDYLRRDDKVAKELLAKLSLTPAEQEAFKRYDLIADNLTKLGSEYGELLAESKKFAAGKFPKQARLDELEKQIADANRVFNSFIDELKVSFGENDKRVAVVDSGTQALLKDLNQPRTVIISTIVDEDRLNLIVTTADSQRAHTVNVKAVDLNRLVADFRAEVKNPLVDPRSTGKKLYDLLFPDALQKDLANIKADTIVWSLDGTLRYMPVAALWDGRQYLVERYANVVITLASRDKLNQVPTDRAQWQGLGVGVSKKFAGFDALTAVPEELCGIINDPQAQARCRALAKDQKSGVISGRSLLDEEFSLQAFKNNLGRYAVVHVASHFSLNPGNEIDSYLLLGSGATNAERKLTLDIVRNEFTTKFVGVELLTLSACNTAMTAGEKSNGGEIEGFGALAQKEGARSVLATLWSVADPSTRDLMMNFYRLVESDKQLSKAQALRRAQLGLLNGAHQDEAAARFRSDLVEASKTASSSPFQKDTKAPYAHPFYWSPFVLYGNWR
jgi:CHAT domain-containing protein/Tfp pilus assembly protein PilF